MSAMGPMALQNFMDLEKDLSDFWSEICPTSSPDVN
jgi:hypothetical protein